MTHVNRKDRDYLLTQLVDPNAIIRKEYLAYSVSTHDGRVSTGLLVDQNAAELTLMAAKEQKTTIPLADVEEIRESNASLMPENVLKQLKPQELRDLFHYLQQHRSMTEILHVSSNRCHDRLRFALLCFSPVNAAEPGHLKTT
ncbi:MAG: hypothetical protein U0872_06315 [Planctomycetaceae bacterium]